MKKTILYAFLGAATLLSSCDSFLDKLPDSRTLVDNEDKITSLLVSAYPSTTPLLITEFATDNVTDNGKEKTIGYEIVNEAYQFKENITPHNDAPKSLWNACYSASSAANQALKAIEDLGNPESLNPQRAEALLCRAYAHFVLANIFCMPYSPTSTALGLPYAEKPETEVRVTYKRGTLIDLYDRINKDIEEALPLVSDNIYKVPKYHFNEKAAYAFASRFNLYYLKYDKVIEYANKVLGSDPLSILRNWNNYTSLAPKDFLNNYIADNKSANLLLIPYYSLAGRIIGSPIRFQHNQTMTLEETFWATGPWGTGGSSGWLISHLYNRGSSDGVFFPKIGEMFEYTDKTSGTGYTHIVSPVFTTDETLLCRAEAYIMKKQYNNALADLNSWLQVRCLPELENDKNFPVLTLQSINDFYNNLDYAPVVLTEDSERSIKKALNPVGFNIEAGDQENLIHCLLHFRRIETVHEGLRWYDIRRYGIEFTHPYEGKEDITLLKDDPRRVFQLPHDVIQAGLQANPR